MADIFKVLPISVAGPPFAERSPVGAVNATAGAADAGKFIILDASGQLSPSMVPATGSVNFSGLLSGTNTAAVMVVAGAASLSGNISANSLFGVAISTTPTSGQVLTATSASTADWATPASGAATELATNTATPVTVDTSAPTHAGQLLISQPGNAAAAWADPQVQGLYPDGSTISPAPVYAVPTTICPVYVGGSKSGVLTGLSLDASGNLNVNVQVGGGSSSINVNEWGGTATTLGQKVSASSVPVVIASDQSAIAVTGAFFQATQPVSIASTVTVSGTVAATQSGTWDVGTVTTLSTITNPVAVTGTFWQATQPVSGTVAVSSVSGSVAVTNSGTFAVQAAQSGTWNVGTLTSITNPVAVTGTFFQATQPVSGTVAVSSVSGSVAVTGTFFQATQPVSGTVAVSSVSGSVAVTGTFFQATQPVSITSAVAVTQSTSPWVVSNGGTFATQAACTQTTSPWVTSDNHFTHNLNQDGSGNVGVNVENTVSVTGTFSGSTVTNVTPGTYVQNAGNSFSSSTTATLTLATNVVSGDTVFIGFSYTSTSTISSVVDNLGNQYKQITTAGPENSLDYALYYATGCFAGATTVTVTFNASTSGEIVGVEYNGQMFLLTQTGSFGTGTTFTTGAQSPISSSRSNYIGIAFAYGQGGTLVTNNASTTSSAGKALSPRFTNSNYMLGDCILSEPATMNFSWAQASSSGYAWILAQMALVNAAQVPLANATFFQKPGAWIPVGGVDTAGNSVTGGVISVQGVSSGGLYIATDMFKQAIVSLTSTASGIGGPTGFALPISGQYQLTQPLLTTSNSNGIVQLDIRGNQLMTVGVQTTTGTAWSSGTAINTLQYLPGNTTEGQLVGVPAMYIQLDMTTPFSAGAVTFQGTFDNVNWVTIPVAQVLNPNTFTQLSNPYTFVASTNQPFLILMQGYQSVRLNLTSTITGAGTVTPYWAAQSVLPEMPQPLPSVTANAPSQQTVTSTSGSVLASNTSRKELRVTNTGTVVVYLGLGQTPTSTAYHVALAACTVGNDGTGGSYTSDLWRGAVNAIVASTSGTVVVTELT